MREGTQGVAEGDDGRCGGVCVVAEQQRLQAGPAEVGHHDQLQPVVGGEKRGSNA